VRPVVLALAEQKVPVTVLNHGVLAQGLPSSIPIVDADAPYGSVCFGTSLTDTIPLVVARSARKQGKPTLAILDNWLNYRSRLATDGLGPFIPDIYAVMDQKAKDEAIADHIPSECLVVTGHPNLASLSTDVERATPQWRHSLRQSLGLGLNGRALIAYVNEPVTNDQGDGPENPLWRGYTEVDALAALAAGLGSTAVDVAIIPHPRDDAAQVAGIWETVRGDCSGAVITGYSGRDIVLASDRVAGMASILLYESWLIGRPTISLQPGLVRDDLLSIASRPGIVLARTQTTQAVQKWLQLENKPVHPDLALHAVAAQTIAALLRFDIGQ